MTSRLGTGKWLTVFYSVGGGGIGWENEGVGQEEGEIQGQKLPVCVPY